jgi:TRAP-type mannitol/chloroaromatic compound transport system permease large subunit
MKGVAPPEITMADIWRAVTPYVIVDLLCLVLVLAIPALATVIPSLMGMK